MSRPKEHTQTRLTPENKCLLSKTAAYKAVELEGINMLTLASILTVALKQNNGRNSEEMYSSFKTLLNGTSQEQISTEILEHWNTIKSSVEALPVSLLLN